MKELGFSNRKSNREWLPVVTITSRNMQLNRGWQLFCPNNRNFHVKLCAGVNQMEINVIMYP